MKLSIIIPIYNTSLYIKQCVNSVLEQGLTDFEILLINDGSTDDSYAVCNTYYGNNPHVRIFSQVNQGLSAARNLGITQAKGEYLIFLDSDDFWVPHRAGDLIATCDGADILVFEYQELYPPDTIKSHYSLKTDCYEVDINGKEFLEQALSDNLMYPWFAWRYAIKSTYIRKLDFHFPYVKTYEDVACIFRLLLNAESIRVMPVVLVTYRKDRPGAITHRVKLHTELDKLSIVEANIKEVATLSNISPQLRKLLCHNFSCLYYSSLILAYSLIDRDERDCLIDRLKALKWVTKFTFTGNQKIVSLLINIIGIKPISYLLNLRRNIKG